MKKSHQNCKKFSIANLSALGCIILQAIIILAAGCTYLEHEIAEYPLQKVNYTILFAYEGQADSLCVSGDFNGWNIHDFCMDFRNGRWELEYQLDSGRYVYAFYINKEKFIPDPQSLIMENDGFGNYNSVVIIP